MKKAENRYNKLEQIEIEKMKLLKHIRSVTGKPDQHQGVRKFAEFTIESKLRNDPNIRRSLVVLLSYADAVTPFSSKCAKFVLIFPLTLSRTATPERRLSG